MTTPKGTYTFDFLIISTGLLTDPAFRPELRLIENHIARWGDRFQPPEEDANLLIDAHPYLSPGFGFVSRDEKGKELLHGLFAFNYSALISSGISASALSGMKFAVPKLVSAVADQFFQDDREEILTSFFTYNEAEFVGEWKSKKELVATPKHSGLDKEKQ